jgi:hypothetical protein
MSDLYSLIAQIAVATQTKDAVRVCNLMTHLTVEMTAFNKYMEQVIAEAREYLENYISEREGSKKETLN